MTIKSSTQTVAIILKKKLKLFTTAVNKSGSCAIIIIYSIILFYSFTFDCTFYLTKHAEQLCNAT